MTKEIKKRDATSNRFRYSFQASYIDREGNIANATREDYQADISGHEGKAYAFFNSKCPKDKLPLVIEDVRDMYRTPKALELSITEGFEKLEKTKEGKELRPLIQQAKEAGMRYVLEARYKGATNQRTADEVKSILEGVYNSSRKPDKTFGSRVFYEDMGRYVFRD